MLPLCSVTDTETMQLTCTNKSFLPFQDLTMFDSHSVTATEIKAHHPNARYAQFYFEDSGCGGEELSAVSTV